MKHKSKHGEEYSSDHDAKKQALERMMGSRSKLVDALKKKKGILIEINVRNLGEEEGEEKEDSSEKDALEKLKNKFKGIK